MEWVSIGTVAELQRRKRTVAEVADRQVAVFWHDGEAFALDNICIHKQRELVKGVILNGRIVCPGHQWAYDLRTGHEQTMDRLIERFKRTLLARGRSENTSERTTCRVARRANRSLASVTRVRMRLGAFGQIGQT